jgi:aminopeptidase N
MRTIIVATAYALICLQAKADSFASRSDSIDILHTAIDLDLTDADIGLIHAHTTLTFTPKVSNINVLPLDLLALTVDSVTMDGSQLIFSQAGETLTIQLGAVFGPGDTLQLTVHYGGDPATDNGGSGFGGFYTGTIYQYVIGVALDDQPHSYGRSWFPCFDNFVERCTFEFTVLSEGGRAVFANGLQTSVTDLGGGLRSTHWTMQGSINAYMATVSAANYPALVDTFPSITGADVPVTLAGLPADTADMRASFGHLHEMFDFFEDRFGPYRWDRVGFVLTPVGAMEHPTNVNFPVSTVDGTFNDEPRISHELSHHWFGDLVTCDRAEEMYINEGFAEYCSYYFVDHFYGHADYMELVRDNHRHMVHQCHLEDEGWWPLSEVPQDWTYGVTPYYKGADIAHTLRSYLGDSLFSAGFTSFFDAYAFQPVNSVEMRDALAAATGVDLTDFFNDWVFQSGWAAFEVDSLDVNPTPLPGGFYLTTAYIEQKLRGPSTYYHNVPLSITFFDALGNSWQHPLSVMVGDQFSTQVQRHRSFQ